MHAGPFVLTVTEQRRNPGVQRPVHVEGPLVDLATSSAGVPEGTDVVADLVLEAMTDGRLTVTGAVQAPWEGECRRCLRPVRGVVEAPVQEVFEDHPAPDAETYRLDGDRVDLEPMVRDAVLLALPLAPLCEEDCAGPDPDEHPVGGAVAAERTAGEQEAEPPVDPRWAKLADLRFDD